MDTEESPLRSKVHSNIIEKLKLPKFLTNDNSVRTSLFHLFLLGFLVFHYYVFIKTSISKSHFRISKGFRFFPECRSTLIFNVLGMIIIRGWLLKWFRIKDCRVPEPIADTVRPAGSRLHKDRLEMRPILSATQTYNFALGKWLDTKLKPVSLNRYTATDLFEFADGIRNLEIANGNILVSYNS